MFDAIKNFLGTTGIAILFGENNWWQYLVMYVIIGALFYLAIVKKFEPLLLLPIAFGMLLANLPGANLIHLDFFFDTYYINVNENGEIVGKLAYEFNAFLSNLNPNLYTIDAANGIINFDFSGLSDDAISELGYYFSQYMDGAATLDASGVHIKMTTMIKEVINNGGLIDILYLGVKLGVYPSLIFMGVGAMTDFSPLIANPKSLLMGF